MLGYEDDIEKCLDTLRKGGLILYPTDTVWGIGCDATNNDSVQKIYDLKKRKDEKSMIVLVADERDILQYVAAPDLAVFDYLENTDRPTTVIYDHAIGLADKLVAADGSVGIRICRDEFCRHLIKRFRKPIVSTSANISGTPTPASYNDVSSVLKAGVDYVARHRQEEDEPGQPSSVIRWKAGAVEIIRP